MLKPTLENDTYVTVQRLCHYLSIKIGLLYTQITQSRPTLWQRGVTGVHPITRINMFSRGPNLNEIDQSNIQY